MGMVMDPKWVEAVQAGDLEFWRNKVDEYKRELEASKGETDSEYDYSSSNFLSHHNLRYNDGGNILHLAAMEGQVVLFEQFIRSLPDRLVHLLLTQHGSSMRNPLHVAAESGHQGIVKLIMGFYANLNSKSKVIRLETKPWLAQDEEKRTPVHSALCNSEEACALEILTPLSDKRENNKDFEELCHIADTHDDTPLSQAMKARCSQVALHILRFAPSFQLRDNNGRTPFHLVDNCSEVVLKLLLKNHPNLIKEVDKDGNPVVGEWISNRDICQLEYIIINVNDFPAAQEFKKHLVYLCDVRDVYDGDNIFHLLAKRRTFDAYANFVNIYREVKAKEIASVEGEKNQKRQLPWLVPNKVGISPLETAMTDNRTAFDEYKRLKTDLSIMESAVEGKCEVLFIAINKGLYHAAEEIWYVQHAYGWTKYPAQRRQFWNAALIFSEEAAIWVAKRLPSLTSEHEEVKYVLRSAAEAGAAQFIEWMLKKDPSSLELEPTVWVEACKRGHFSTVMAFINHCPYFREICIEQKDTPLHHIKFRGFRQYLDFLKDPIVLALKNSQDINGETPLHKSIRNRKNLLLTEVLLTTDDVIRSIEDNEHKTAMDLLVKACGESREWDEMCKRNGIIPGLQTTYFQDKTNLLEVRNTLSVVAALLATITFTAGFTLPGGVQSDSSGKPTLGNTAAFLVFLLIH